MSPPSAIEVQAVTDTTGVTLPNPLTAPPKINDMYGRRKAQLNSQWGVAAASTSESFRLRDHSHKPMAKRWDRK